MQFRQGFFAVARPCPECAGSGEKVKDPCPDCRGEGRVREGAHAHDRDPGRRGRRRAPAPHGRGQLGAARRTPRRPLRASSRWRRTSIFRRDGGDVILAWAVPFHLAALGGSMKVPTLHGDATFELPAGTAAGRVFTLKGKGIPRLDGRGKGDQHVLVTIRVPKKMTHAQKEAVEKLAEAFEASRARRRRTRRASSRGSRISLGRRRPRRSHRDSGGARRQVRRARRFLRRFRGAGVFVCGGAGRWTQRLGRLADLPTSAGRPRRARRLRPSHLQRRIHRLGERSRPP